MLKASLVAFVLLGAAACGDTTSSDSSAANASAKAVPAAMREVRCGCKIDGIGKCGNYVSVDGKWLEITNREERGLGVMEWCSADSKVEAEVAGELDAKGIRVSSLTVK
jgi:hypothetical protein